MATACKCFRIPGAHSQERSSNQDRKSAQGQWNLSPQIWNAPFPTTVLTTAVPRPMGRTVRMVGQCPDFLLVGHKGPAKLPAGLCGRCTGVSVPLRVMPSSTGLPSKRCPGIGFFSRAYQKIGVFQHVVPPTRLRLEFPRETGLILRCAGKVRNPLQTKQGNRPTARDQTSSCGAREVRSPCAWRGGARPGSRVTGCF